MMCKKYNKVIQTTFNTFLLKSKQVFFSSILKRTLKSEQKELLCFKIILKLEARTKKSSFTESRMDPKGTFKNKIIKY